MKPIIFSEKKIELGWHRDQSCFDIDYKESDSTLFSIFTKSRVQSANKNSKTKHKKKTSII